MRPCPHWRGELAPGHRLLVRGVCLDGERFSLYYAWTPGLSEAMGEDSGIWLSAGRAWFDFYATTDDHHRARRVTIDLTTRRVQLER